VQVSFQAAEAKLSDFIGGYKAFEKKREAVTAVKQAELHLSLNVVLHRMNLDQVDEIIQLAEEMGAERLELANTQYYNWALLNRENLLPSLDQIERARAVYEAAKARLKRKMEIIWVIPDYYASAPKPCMGGWGAIGLTVAPNGIALPCPTAGIIKGLSFENVCKSSLGSIWYESESFNRFRGEEGMPKACLTCDLRHQDGGGCRCQAFALTGDAYAMDPVCQWAPEHHLIEKAVQDANSKPVESSSPLIYRRYSQDRSAIKRLLKK
jgi:pyrroloquinoline quinone biosynthesis protein E